MANYKLTETTSDPAVELADAKEHLGIPSFDTRYDDQITKQIAAATRWCENESGILLRELVQFSMQVRGWHREYKIPSVPLNSVTEVFYAEDGAIALQTVDSEFLDVTTSDRTRGVLRISDDFDFPALDPNSAYPVDITYSAGWLARSLPVPEEAEYAILLILSTLFDHDLDHRQLKAYRDRAIDLLAGLDPGVYS